MTQSTKKIGYRRKKGAHKAHAASRVVPNKAQHRGRSSSAMVGREDDAGMGGDDDAEIDDNEGDDAKIDDSEDEYEEHAFFPNHDLRLLQGRGPKKDWDPLVKLHNADVPILRLANTEIIRLRKENMRLREENIQLLKERMQDGDKIRALLKNNSQLLKERLQTQPEPESPTADSDS